MTPDAILAALSDRQTLACTAWAEARKVPRGDHSPVEELIAVMVVVRNRLPHFAQWRASVATYKAICLAPSQFSCWNPNSGGPGSNHDALMVQAGLLVDGAALVDRLSLLPVGLDPELRECLYLADGVIIGELRDRTDGANSYWAPAAMLPVGRVPAAAVGKAHLLIGDQYFFVDPV
jgi:hypothetical protein